ncbi:MAG TPA: CerR family C-terminal domain-containing protein [Parvibaculum sp.]|jgi:AcrR family transcriptional regulator
MAGQSQNTKERLLEAARGLFAERGYHNATVRDIAARAHTNLASINYYFRSKDDLYREVMRSSFQAPAANGEAVLAPLSGADHPPEERLRAFVRRLIPVSTEEAGDEQHKRLMAWEMLAPTGAIERVEEWEIKPHLDAAQDAVRPFLSGGAGAADIMTTALWLVGQCLVFRKLAAGAGDGFHPIAFTPENSAQLVDLVVTLALRGLGA